MTSRRVIALLDLLLLLAVLWFTVAHGGRTVSGSSSGTAGTAQVP
jgi:hypothetical protein